MGQTTLSHIHAALMAEYAKDATITNKPWELWEHSLKSHDGEWLDCEMHGPSWNPEWNYRRKLKVCSHCGQALPEKEPLVENQPKFNEGNPPSVGFWLTTERGFDNNDIWYYWDGMNYFGPFFPNSPKSEYQWRLSCKVHSRIGERMLWSDYWPEDASKPNCIRANFLNYLKPEK